MHAQINTRFDPSRTTIVRPRAEVRPARAHRKEDAGAVAPQESRVMDFLRRVWSAAMGYGF